MDLNIIITVHVIPSDIIFSVINNDIIMETVMGVGVKKGM